MPLRFAQEEAPSGLEAPRQGLIYARAFGGGDVVQDEVDHHCVIGRLGQVELGDVPQVIGDVAIGSGFGSVK